MPIPDYEAFINQCWQGGDPGFGYWCSPLYGAGSNISAVGGNPPYGVVDFLAFYPGFGPATLLQVTGEITQDSDQLILDNPAPSYFVAGLNIQGQDLPPGTTVLAIADDEVTVTMSAPALATADETISSYPPNTSGGFIPQVVLNAFVAYGYACISWDRYRADWFMAIGFFIAHYCTLYLRSMAGNSPQSLTAGQLATAGLEKGITLQKSAFDVSSGAAQPQGIEDWGTFTETTFGSQFATIARGAPSMGSVLLR